MLHIHPCAHLPGPRSCPCSSTAPAPCRGCSGLRSSAQIIGCCRGRDPLPPGAHRQEPSPPQPLSSAGLWGEERNPSAASPAPAESRPWEGRGPAALPRPGTALQVIWEAQLQPPPAAGTPGIGPGVPASSCCSLPYTEPHPATGSHRLFYQGVRPRGRYR